MLTITVPDDHVLAGLADISTGEGPGGLRRVRVVPWDMSAPFTALSADQVDVAVVPHYFTKPEGLARLHDLPGLRMVQIPSAGFDHVLPHLADGVVLCNGGGVHDDSTSEHALALTLAAQRGIDVAARNMTTGAWRPQRMPALADKRVVLIGYGSIGRAIARRFDGFGVDLVAVATTARQEDRPVVGWEDLPELLPTADVVVLIVPLTPQTERMVDARFLSQMADGALLVNVARGKVVDTDALLAELRSGRLRAALDVTDPEPLPTDHPLWSAPNVLITPHAAAVTDLSAPRFAALVRRQVLALAAGQEPVNVVAGGPFHAPVG